MSYIVNEKARAVVFSCPHCAAELRRPLNEAGTRQPCPGCMSVITVPGAVEVGTILRDERREAEDRHRIEAWARSNTAAAASPEQEGAVVFPRAERLLSAPPSREDEALLHAFPAPALLADQRSAAAKPADAAVRARGAPFPAARVLLLLLLLLVVAVSAWFVAGRAASGW